MKKIRTLLILLSIVAVVGVFSFLLMSSFGESMVYYKTVDEFTNESKALEGKTVRLSGLLVPNSLRQKEGTQDFLFDLTKAGKTIRVSYTGMLPDSFDSGRDIIAQGNLAENDSVFEATEILTKCPSKYEAKAKAYDSNPQPKPGS